MGKRRPQGLGGCGSGAHGAKQWWHGPWRGEEAALVCSLGLRGRDGEELSCGDMDLGGGGVVLIYCALMFIWLTSTWQPSWLKTTMEWA